MITASQAATTTVHNEGGFAGSLSFTGMSGAIGSLWNRYPSVPPIYRIAIAFLLGSLAGAVFGE